MAASRLVIAIDCDDVLISTAHHIINDYNSRYGTTLGLEHMYEPVTLDEWGTDDSDVAIERVNEFLRSKQHEAIAPDPEAVAAIKVLSAQHELHLITGRADFLKSVTRRMVEEHFKGCFASIEHTNFIVPSTHRVTQRSKGDVCRSICADILIDDHMKHGVNALETDVKKVILFGDYPWNQEKLLPGGMVRCSDWASTLEEVGAYGG